MNYSMNAIPAMQKTSVLSEWAAEAGEYYKPAVLLVEGKIGSNFLSTLNEIID